MRPAPITRKPLRSVSMTSTCSFRAVSVDDVLNRVHPPQRGEARIAECVLNLVHPITHSALDAVLHFTDDGFNQCSISCNGIQRRTQPFLWKRISLTHPPELRESC